MPSATNAMWLSRFGRLPWWRGPAYFRQQLAKSAQSSTRIEKELSKGPHSFATTQLDLPNDLQAKLRAWVNANVAREDLSPDEAQDDAFHITVLYGLKTDQHEVIRQFVEGTGPVRIELGAVAQFDKDPRYDVLIVPVVKEAGLRALRKRLTDQLPWEATQDGYAPHVTLAYVRKGAGRRHLGATAFLGEAATVDRLRVSDSQGITSWVSLLPVMTLKKPNGNSRTYAAPVDLLKEGETLTFNPETGERGVWRNVGGRSVFIAVRKGESVPKAIKRVQKEGEEKGQQERGTMATRAAAELSPTYEPPAGSPLANPEIRKQAIAQAEESLTYSSIVGLGLAMRKRAQELFTGEPMRSGVGMQDAAAFVRLMEQRFLPAGVKVDDLIRTMYADTQRQLTEQGTTSMKLYRGTNNPAVMAAKRKRPEPTVDVLVDMRGFSSWSQSERAASKFGSSVIEADVPASMIWSIPKTFFDVPAGLGFLMTSGPRRFEEEVILVPTQRLQGRVGKSLQSTRRGFSSFFSLDKAVGVTLDDVAEAPRPDRKLEVWLLIHALRRVNPTLDRAAIKAQVGELLGRTGSVNAEKSLTLVITPHGYPLSLSREPTRIERTVEGELLRGRVGVRLFQGKPIDPLKEGEVLTFNPETGERGVWRNIGGRSVFIAVRKGESVPEAVRRTQEAPSESQGDVDRPLLDVAEEDIQKAARRLRLSPANVQGQSGHIVFQLEQEQQALNEALSAHFSQVAPGTITTPGAPRRTERSFLEMTPQEIRKAGTRFHVPKELVAEVRTQAAARIAVTRWLASVGGKGTLTLYRGVGQSGAAGFDEVRHGILSSWSINREEAEGFVGREGGKLLVAQVPIDNLLISHRTAPATLSEGEYIVLNRGMKARVRELASQRTSRSTGEARAVARGSFGPVFTVLERSGMPVALAVVAALTFSPEQATVLGEAEKKSLTLVITPHGYPLSLSREPTRIERTVDFATIVLEGDRLQAQSAARVKAVLTNARDKLLALVERKHTAGELTAKFVLDLELRGLGQLVPTLREALGAFFRFGQRTAEGELRRGRAGVRLFAKPVEALKEGETLTFNPETGERGVWRNIGGRSVFISVKKGESVPDAVRRAQNVKQRTPPVGKRGGLPSQSPDPSSVLGSDPASSASGVVVGSSDQAEQFASGSARPGRWFHGAEARFSDPAEALRMSVPGQTRGAVFGSGVYLTDSADEATEYGDRVFEARVQVKNPLIYPTEASSFQRLMDQTEPSRRASVAKRVRAFRDAVRRAAEHSGKSNEEVITAIARRSGYDAIEVWHPDRTWLVVPDPHRIMVIAGRSKKTALAGNGKTYQVKLVPEGLPPEAALEFFERKASLWATDVRGPLLQSTKAVLFDAIKRGAPLRETIAMLEQVFLPWVGDEDALRGDGDVTAPFRLETLVRTNTNESFNEGRKAQFQEEVDSGFVIGFQFSAIIDSRTTPVCAFLDEKIFRTDSPELDRLTPPRHFGCRSILSPVLRTEGPVEYITQRQVARGIDLSGAGFVERRPSREVVVDKEMAYAEA